MKTSEKQLASQHRYLEKNRDKHNASVRAYYQQRREYYAALVAAAAEVTALWASYAWHDTATFAEFEDAVARLDALLPERRP